MKPNDLWKVFNVEFQQHIDDADSAIYQVISLQPHNPEEILRSIFRSFHSLKGLARAMNLKHLEETTHKLEDFLQTLSSSKTSLTPEKAHSIGSALAEIQTLCEAISQKQEDLPPSTALKEIIIALTNSSPSKAPIAEGNAHPPENNAEHQVASKEDAKIRNAIQETDEGVIAFFLELVSDLLNACLEQAPPTQQQKLLIAASTKLEFYSFLSTIETLDSEYNWVENAIVELFNARTIDTSLLITVENLPYFYSSVVVTAFKVLSNHNKQNKIDILKNALINHAESNLLNKTLISLFKEKISSSSELLPEKRLEIFDALKDAIQEIFSQSAFEKQTENTPTKTKSQTEERSTSTIATNPTLNTVPPKIEKSIRVSSSTLENFMDNIGEIVLNNTRLNHFLKDKEYKDFLGQVQFLLKNKNSPEINFTTELLNLIEALEAKNIGLNNSIHSLNSSLSLLHDTALDLRVVPMELLYRKLPRTVNLIAGELSKEVQLSLEGQDVQIDKIMVDMLSDPILHIVRNALDHGIESPAEREHRGKPRAGKIVITTEQQGSRIQLQISDDGQGINTERIAQKALEKGLISEQEIKKLSKEKIMNYIFHPGLSTAQEVSSISGRGVGMDVVRMNVMQLGGTINISSEIGKGTTFTIRIPITASVQDVLVVEAGSQKIAIPNTYVNEVAQISSEQILTVQNNYACILREQYLPIINLGHVLGYSKEKLTNQNPNTIVIISQVDSTIGLEVTRVIEKTQVYMKEIDSSISSVFGIGGATIRGDGQVMIILDCEDIFKSVAV